MAGRGRGMTLPAWMTKGGENGSGDLGDGGGGSRGDHQGEPGKYEDAPHLKPSYSVDSGADAAPMRENKENKERDDDRTKSRDRDRGSRDRSRERRRGSSRERSRSRDRSRRSRRSRSRSGSRSPPRRRKRTSNFDVPPTGMTLESAKAAELLSQSVLQQQPPQQHAPPQPVMSHIPAPVLTMPNPISLNPYQPGGLGQPALAVRLPTTLPTGMGLAAANMQQTRHARRIYVGGISETSDYELRDFFNDVIVKALEEPIEGGAVVSVYINADRHFAFVELKSIELTTACVQQLDGITFKGQPVKIRRPTDYQPHLVPPSNLPIPRLNLAKLGIIGTTVPDGPDKIFIGGLPYNLTVDQVKELLAAFGPLKSFHLVTDSHTGQSKGYAFCEYEDATIGPVACQHLNSMRLGDKTLTVRIAMSQTEAKTAQAAAGSVNSALSMGINPAVGASSGLTAMSGLGAQAALSFASVGLGAYPGMVPQVMVPATRVLVLENMVTEDELRDDQEYEEIVDDVRGEVSKYGTVQSLVIPRPPGNSSVGKIFIEYAAATMSEAASRALTGRQFGGRQVKISFYDEGKFAQQDLV